MKRMPLLLARLRSSRLACALSAATSCCATSSCMYPNASTDRNAFRSVASYVGTTPAQFPGTLSMRRRKISVGSQCTYQHAWRYRCFRCMNTYVQSLMKNSNRSHIKPGLHPKKRTLSHPNQRITDSPNCRFYMFHTQLLPIVQYMYGPHLHASATQIDAP